MSVSQDTKSRSPEGPRPTHVFDGSLAIDGYGGGLSPTILSRGDPHRGHLLPLAPRLRGLHARVTPSNHARPSNSFPHSLHRRRARLLSLTGTFCTSSPPDKGPDFEIEPRPRPAT